MDGIFGAREADRESVRYGREAKTMARMRNTAAGELTERHQSLVTRTETLINELHCAGPAQTEGRGGGGRGGRRLVFHL